jgi:uncharacterized protein
MTLPTLPACLLLLCLVLCSTAASADYEALDWVRLLPDSDFQALLSAPPIQHEGGDIGAPSQPLLKSEASTAFGSAFEQALVSTAVRQELDNREVSLPGFVVPLEYDANQNVTEFFLVPYFGACIHVPPPPPNQIIFVSYPQGLALPSIFEPFTVEGRLLVSTTSNDTALSAYRIDADMVSLYQE